MENIKNSYKKLNLKYQLQRKMINFNYVMDRILYDIFKIIFRISSIDMKQ